MCPINKVDTDLKKPPTKTGVGIEGIEEDKEDTSSSFVGDFKQFTPEELEDALGPYQE